MIEMFFEIGINLLETLIITDFITRYLGTKYNGYKKNTGFLLCWLATFTVICAMNNITSLETIGAYIEIVDFISYIFGSICYCPYYQFSYMLCHRI